MKLFDFIGYDDNPTGIKKYIGPLFPVGNLRFYAPISNGYKYIREKNGTLAVKENTGSAIIVAYNDEFLGAIEIGEMLSTKDELKEVKIKDIKDKDYRELLEKIVKFADENRIFIKQYAYSAYNNKK